MIVPSPHELLFLPIGGSDEIGMNLNLLGCNGQWLMMDCGVTFFDRYGIDIITPDPTFLKEHKSKIIGLVVTHAHEDHIGAIPYIWPFFKAPIYGTEFTVSIIKEKLKDVPFGKSVPIHTIPLSGKVDVGCFGVEFITLTHSIPEPNALAVHTPVGTIVHTGDWKIDPSPFVGESTDIAKLKDLGDKGVIALICDSTNVFCEGTTGSEKEVREGIFEVMGKYHSKRITFGCFASNVARVETIALAAKKHKRKVCLLGRSLIKMVTCAKKVGYLDTIDPLISLDEALDLPPSKVVFISTGSQGEYRAALSRIAFGQHRVKMNENDVVIFSSRVIPGNEKNIAAIQNKFTRQNVSIVTAKGEDIHVSGHPSRDELKQMYEWVRPEVLIPVHGEARHLYEHAAFGKQCGIKHTIVPHNGSLIRVSPGEPKIIDSVSAQRWMYDGNRMIPSNSNVLKERQSLSQEGAAVISIFLDKKSGMKSFPKIIFMGLSDNSEVVEDLTQSCLKLIRGEIATNINMDSLQEDLKINIKQLLFQKTGKKPRVYCLIHQ